MNLEDYILVVGQASPFFRVCSWEFEAKCERCRGLVCSEWTKQRSSTQTKHKSGRVMADFRWFFALVPRFKNARKLIYSIWSVSLVFPFWLRHICSHLHNSACLFISFAPIFITWEWFKRSNTSMIHCIELLQQALSIFLTPPQQSRLFILVRNETMALSTTLWIIWRRTNAVPFWFFLSWWEAIPRAPFY